MAEHCMQVIFPFRDTNLDPIFALEDLLIAALERDHVGEYDGNDVGAGEGTLFLYGPDADALFNTVLPILRTSSLTKAGRVVKRYGPPEDGVRGETIQLSASEASRCNDA
jgi:hypothetical protein